MRVALLSVHACPLASLGAGKAGGMNVYIRQLARHLARLGLQVDVFTRWHGPCPPARNGAHAAPEAWHVTPLGNGVRVVHLAAGPASETVARIPRHLDTFADALEAFAHAQGLRYDVLHAHYWLSGVVGVRLRQRWGAPLAVSFHTLAEVKRLAHHQQREPRARSRGERHVLAHADRVVALTEHERGLLGWLYGVPLHRVQVVPAGVDPDLFHPLDRTAARQQLGLGEEHVLLYVGRIEPLKGVDLLLHAAAAMEAQRPLRVLVVGGGPRDQGVARLQRLARDLHIAPLVRFEGAVPQESLPLYYSAADVCVVPSFYESFGLVALEAMACGTPVVAARVGGLATLVQHGRTGYLVPWHCPDPYVNALEALLSSPDLREAMGRAARQWAQGMSWETTARRIADLYTALAGRAHAHAAGT